MCDIVMIDFRYVILGHLTSLHQEGLYIRYMFCVLLSLSWLLPTQLLVALGNNLVIAYNLNTSNKPISCDHYLSLATPAHRSDVR